ncbi:hypothetical protein BDB00DRAFT_790927 [Zychaea mexicana]|uniref:uncharacterized protein n=1 Tax=Zychaea mexicana TaxID=64656 RepID=UPI0022FEF622|nr:uncharacterized protein BDB00DRAFT_790927 [Zychaea mexicana]KAI9489616.1 hypothetical protein BDB00DRAFT_790927 [Zychaea mexicana]
MARTKKTARKVDFSATTPLSKKQARHLAVIAVSASQDPTKFEGIPFGGYGVVCDNKGIPNVSGSLFGTFANSLCIELEANLFEVTAGTELAKAYDEQEMQQLNEHASLMQGASSTSYLQQQQQQSTSSNTYLQQQLLVPSDMQLQQLLSQLPQSQQRESPSSDMQPYPTTTYVQTTVSSVTRGPASVQADVKPSDAHANPDVHQTNNNNNNNSNDITIISDDDDDDGDEIYVDAVDYTGWTDLERKRPQIRTLETMNKWITDIFRGFNQ